MSTEPLTSPFFFFLFFPFSSLSKSGRRWGDEQRVGSFFFFPPSSPPPPPSLAARRARRDGPFYEKSDASLLPPFVALARSEEGPVCTVRAEASLYSLLFFLFPPPLAERRDGKERSSLLQHRPRPLSFFFPLSPPRGPKNDTDCDRSPLFFLFFFFPSIRSCR